MMVDAVLLMTSNQALTTDSDGPDSGVIHRPQVTIR
jgi:hypothetical protein